MIRFFPAAVLMAALLTTVFVAHAQSTAPTISTVAITSNPGTNNTYATGDIIMVSVTFSEAVTVTGTPYVTLDIDSGSRNAAYTGAGTATGQVLFAYTVLAGERDTDGVSVSANSLALSGGTIQADDDSDNATLTHAAMAFPSHKVAAGRGYVSVGLAQVGIAVVAVLADPDRTISNEAWQWQRSATQTGTYSDIPAAEGGTSVPYTPSAGDLGMWLKATVTYDDTTGTGWTAEATTLQRVMSQPTLSNAGHAHPHLFGYVYSGVSVTHRYAQAFTTGSHTRGYLLTAVRLALFKVAASEGNSVDGAWAVHANDAGKPAAEPLSAALPILSSDLDEETNTFEEFTHPDGVHLDPATKYWIVISKTNPDTEGALGVAGLSDWDTGLAAGLTAPPMDTGSEADWSLSFDALSHYEEDPDNTRQRSPDPALLPWVPLADAMELPLDTKLVLRISLVAPVELPEVTVEFAASDYTAAEGGSVSVEVELSADPERTVTIPITKTEQGGATSSDYSGVPASVTFNTGETSKTFTFNATDDSVDDDGESVKLGLGALPSRVTKGTTGESVVSITDDDKPASLTVKFEQSTYRVGEGSSVAVKLILSDDPEQDIVIPITTANQGGATSADYEPIPTAVTFRAGETSTFIVVTAVDDTVDDDTESVRLSFGTLPTTPAAVTQVSPSETVVSITDDDVPEVTVNFQSAALTVAEGNSATVRVTLNADPERTVTIPITSTNEDGASDQDYSGVPASVTITSGNTSATFSVSMTQDTIDDDGESIELGFGAMPTRVSQGATNELAINITDDDDPQVSVSFEQAQYSVDEGQDIAIKVVLSADPERSVAIPISRANLTGASNADYSVPANVTFASGDTEKTITFTTTQDTIDDDGEKVRLEFGSLPARVAAGTTSQTTVSITDDDDPQVSVSFGANTYAVAEGETRTISLTLNADPERTVAIPVIVAANQGGATSADYSGVPASVTFNAGQTSRTLTFTATQDTLDDDDESVRLEFDTLPARVSEGTTDETTVNIRDDDDPAVTVSFGASAYTAPEGGSATVEVTLSADPERTVVIPLTKTEQAGVFPIDYSGVPSSVTFNSGQTSRTFTFTAAQDDEDDDDESVRLGFGALPARVSEGTNDETTVNIGDDDDPHVTVGFGADTYEIAEGSTRLFTVSLNGDPERTISVPLVVAADQGGATSADYSGVPTSVTFNAGQTSRTFTFNATDDTVDDDGESVKLGFGTLPPRVSLGARDETTVSITDDDDPEVRVAFVQDAYRVVEGRTVTVRITLSADPERTVAIPLSKTEQNGASSADYSGVPASITFNSGETSKTFDFVAADDTLSDTGESVKLTFGGLPDRVSTGTPAETTVTIRQVSAQFQLDCSQAEWCADLKLDDYTAVDWGWSQLQYNGSFSPPANLSVKSFIFRGVEYTIRAVYVVPGIYPEIDNAYNRVQRGQGEFLMSISHGEIWEAAPEGHYQDWELHIGGIVLPFGEAALWGKRWFLWYGLEFQEIFTDWTSSTVNKIGIREIPSVQHLPTVPPAPAYVSAAAQDSDGLWVSWRSPWTRQRNKAITGYIVQWKQASHSWSDSPRVSSMEVGPKSISAQVNGLTEGVLYTVRVIATNAVGDGPPSEDAIGRPQPQTPHLVSAVVNGQTLTMRYNRQLDMNSVPAESAFMVIAGQGLREVSSVSISGADVTLTLAQAVTSIDKVQAGYVAPATASATFLRDREGNHVYTLGGDLPSVTNETDPALLQPLTARFTNVPASHDGGDSFTFNIEFSESVWVDAGLGKDTLLRVTGGTVTAAHWLDRRTEEWEVTIQPSQDGAIVVVLPGGRSCLTKGAVCAAGDRVLSGEKTMTITGPTSQMQAANNPATGAPTINGTARAGETLTAITTGISDTDGLTSATFAYQWLADDSDISGATGRTYTVVDGDEGKSIRVRVSFTDDAGNAETLTSAVTAAVTVPALRLQGAAVDGAALTLTYNNDLDEGVTLPASAFTVTVAANTRSVSDVSVSNRAVTLTLASAVEAGEAVGVSYGKPDGSSFIRDTLGNRAGSFSGETATNNTSDSTDTSQRSEPLEPEAQAPGAPRNLRATTGNSGELAVSWDAPRSNDVSEITGYKVQWKETSDSWDTLADVSETTVTGTAHTITELTDGTEYDVQVRAVNSEGAGEASSEATATPVNPTPLTASAHGVPSSHDGSTAFTFELRFSESPAASFSYATVQNHAFTVTGGSVSNVRRLEPGKNVRWEITVTPSSDADVILALNVTTGCSAEGAICTDDGLKLSGALDLVVPGPPENSEATGAPTINGTALVGETLTASTLGISDADGLVNASYTYQWLADDADINGATASSYTLVAADAGKAIKVTVSFTDDEGNEESVTSAATGTVAAAPSPLTASIHNAPDSHDGSAAFTFEVRFSEDMESFSYTTLQEHALTVTGGSVSKARRLEAGKNIRWEITVQPSSNADVTIALPITTDCTAQGAICTGDGRSLSNRLELTVSGPRG